MEQQLTAIARITEFRKLESKGNLWPLSNPGKSSRAKNVKQSPEDKEKRQKFQDHLDDKAYGDKGDIF